MKETSIVIRANQQLAVVVNKLSCNEHILSLAQRVICRGFLFAN